MENLEPNTKYTVSVVTVDESGRTSEPTELKMKTKIGSSPVFRQPNITTHAITDEFIPIYVYAASERNGPVRYSSFLEKIVAKFPSWTGFILDGKLTAANMI